MICPRCLKNRLDPIDLGVIPSWGYCTACDHIDLEKDDDDLDPSDLKPIDFNETEQ